MTFKEWWKVRYLSIGTTVKDIAEQAYKAGAGNRYPTAEAYEAVCAALHRREDELAVLKAVIAKLTSPQYTTQPNTVLGGTDILCDDELIATLSPKCKVTPKEFIARVKEGTR